MSTKKPRKDIKKHGSRPQVGERMRGRPNHSHTCTPELMKAVLAFVREGSPPRQACIAMGVSPQTHANWRGRAEGTYVHPQSRKDPAKAVPRPPEEPFKTFFAEMEKEWNAFHAFNVIGLARQRFTRVRKDAEGKPILDEKGKPVEDQADPALEAKIRIELIKLFDAERGTTTDRGMPAVSISTGGGTPVGVHVYLPKLDPEE